MAAELRAPNGSCALHGARPVLWQRHDRRGRAASRPPVRGDRTESGLRRDGAPSDGERRPMAPRRNQKSSHRMSAIAPELVSVKTLSRLLDISEKTIWDW